MDIEEFKRRLREKMAENRQAFEGLYKDELNGLMGLSRAEIDAITPDLTDLEIYDQLITVVKEASRMNLAQAELKSRIEELGEVAVAIARKVPTLAALFI
jgi:Glu-tRNA(Gln) amidotransferase subunit E-like FAD-binding protein